MISHHSVVILFTLLIALMATIMPMPLSVEAFRPDWVLIVLMYWCMALPTRVNVITAWVMGFLLDVLLGSVLGVHAAAMAITVFLMANSFQKIRNFSLWQQSLIIGVLATLYHLIVFWLQRTLIDVTFLMSYLYPVITSIVLWPWVFLLLRKARRHLSVQ